MTTNSSFTEIRYYTQFDPYFFSVDNRPLQDLAYNDQILATAIDNINVNILTTLALPSGSNTVGFSHANTYLAGSVGAVLKNAVYIKNAPYNAVCDGVADDTTAITAALAASNNVIITGTPLISSTIDVLTGKQLIGVGALGSVYLIKKSTMTSLALIIRTNAKVIGVGIQSTSGATGGGVFLAGNSSSYEDALLTGVASDGDGVRIGTISGSHLNCNSWFLKRIQSKTWGGHGFNIHDGTGPTTAPDANAGNAIQCFAQSNSLNGFNIGNAAVNNFTGCLSENNTLNGMLVGVAGSYRCFDNMIIGGDYEANGAGQLVFDTSSVRNGYLGLSNESVTNNGYFTLYALANNIGTVEANFTPVVFLSNQASVALSSVVVSGTTLTFTTGAAHGLSVGDYIWQSTIYAGASGGFVVTAVDTPVSGVTYTITLRSEINYPWTPIVTGVLSGSVWKACGASASNGHYRIEGGRCSFSARIVLSSKTSTGIVEFVLPFNPRNMTNIISSCATINISGTSGTFSSSGMFGLQIVQNTSLNQNINKQFGVGLTTTGLLDSDIGPTSTFIINGEFWV